MLVFLNFPIDWRCKEKRNQIKVTRNYLQSKNELSMII